ncbi:MAG: DUF2892 domain-containing protein [Bacteroidales bacterium]
MKKNVGKVDKIIRLLAALLIGVLYFTSVISGTLALILGIIALVFVFTSFMGFCGIYKLLGINTCPIKRNADSSKNET